jgi:hypothetical protein
MPNKEPIRQFARIIFSGEVEEWGDGEMGRWGNFSVISKKNNF